MNLNSSDLITLAEIAITAAQKAGKLIHSYAYKDVKVNSKSTGNSLASQVVTDVDIKAQKIILDMLKLTILKYDLGLLTEESVDDKSRLEKDYFWCIDPLDGTLAFTEQKPGYSVSIALVSQKGESVIGVIYNPIDKVLYHAIKGQGAYKNSDVFNFGKDVNSTFMLTYDRSSVNNPNFQLIKGELLSIIDDFECNSFEALQHGGAVMNACHILESRAGCYFKLPKNKQGGGSLWDFAATSCLFTELGAHISDINGDKLNLNRADSTFMNSKGVLFATNYRIAKKIMLIYNVKRL